MPPHTRRRDLPRTAWLQAAAFADTARRKDGTAKHSNPRVWAAASWPGYLLSHAVMGHRNLYLTPSGQGVIGLYRAPAWGILTRGAVYVAPAYIVTTAIFAGGAPRGGYLIAAALGLAYLVTMVALIIAASFSGRRSRAPEDTPRIAIPRAHVTLGIAAAHPTAPRGETFGHARRLISALPLGTTVITHPRTAKLRALYEAEGFRPSRGVVMVKSTAPHDRGTVEGSASSATTTSVGPR